MNAKFYPKSAFMLLLLLMTAGGAWAQTNFFTPVKRENLRENVTAANKNILKMNLVSLNGPALRNYLSAAPLESNSRGVSLLLDIPMPDGSVQAFEVTESPILSPQIAARHPEIKTYSGRGKTDKSATIRFSLTSSGFDAILSLKSGDAVYIQKYAKDLPGIYSSYFVRDVMAPAGAPKSRCGVSLDPDIKEKVQHSAGRLMSGEQLRTFRIAIAGNAEFTAQNGGTAGSAFNVIVAYVNRMTLVFKNELSVQFSLVSGTNLVYTNAATDPYTNADQSAMLGQNQANVDAVIGTANYDVAHVLGYSGAVAGAGGVAELKSLCKEGFKAQGVSQEGDPAFYSQLFQDQVLFHEVGHQFGMTHSYNSNLGICDTRVQSTSVEPGAGATIMSYGFICAEAPPSTNTDDYFPSTQVGLILTYHTVNYSQAIAYLATVSCGTTTATGNTAPTVTMPAAFTIPKSTPFSLTGGGADANGDNLTYSWEGTDPGTVAKPDATTLTDPSKPPFFRTYEPSASPTRTYPLLSAILDGTNTARGDKLPSVSFVTNHRLTVRDNNPNGGGVAFGSVTVTVDGGSGPFLETTNLAGSYPGSSVQTITWSVNNTDVAPVNSPNVDILLSTDGGMTFPTVLVEGTPNDGSEDVELPAVLTSTARIKVASSNNIFFDISNSDFSIQSGLPTDVPIVSLTAPDSIATEPPHSSSGGRLGATSSAAPSRVVRYSANARTAADEPVTDHAIFRFERDNADERLEIEFEISGTAIHNVDHFFDDTTHFEKGEFAFDLYVYPGHDLHPEDDETLTLTLLDPDHYDVHPSDDAATITIRDNDNVSCGPNGKNVKICYYGVEQCVSQKIAARYIKLGAKLGGCNSGARLGVEEAPLQLSMKAFPNPVQDNVMLEVLAPQSGLATFQVLDLAGRARQSRSESLTEGRNEVEFRLGKLPSGIYLIRMLDGQGKQAVLRVNKE